MTGVSPWVKGRRSDCGDGRARGKMVKGREKMRPVRRSDFIVQVGDSVVLNSSKDTTNDGILCA